ncbi:DUF3618 domain-containing protein [Steroidobacter flavus]|uniref:DUF3618 domain-containing protein n=1 Tax=Steroidobacter flavus TaxID=1842136 RepID=A0ABV8SY77_9GAMM
MNTSTHRHTADLEREGDEIRADMDRTLDEIERQLSPRELLDRSVEFVREHGSDLMREAGDTVRRNPLPVLLSAAGLVWLTAAVARSRSQNEGYRSHIDEDLDSFDDFAEGQGYASREYSTDDSTLRRAGSHFNEFVREQPVVVGALALAAGALLGAALPMTEYESRTMGPVHDRAMAKVSEAGRRGYEKVREAVAPATRESGDEGSPDNVRPH